MEPGFDTMKPFLHRSVLIFDSDAWAPLASKETSRRRQAAALGASNAKAPNERKAASVTLRKAGRDPFLGSTGSSN